MKMCVTIQKCEEDEFSWQKVCEVLLPTKDFREAMEKTENNPVARGSRWCFRDEEMWQGWLGKRRNRRCQGLSKMYPVGKNLNGR